MKQTKKLTRNQREMLQRSLVDTTGCRLVRETNEYIDFLKPNGEVERFWKGSAKDVI